jgi:phage terminase small subunit
MLYNECEEQEQKFIDKYLTTLDPMASAIEAGYDRKNATRVGLQLLAREDLKEAIKDRRQQLNTMIDTMDFEKEDLMRIYWDMFNDAKRKGKLADARAILADIANYNGVKPDEVKKQIAVLQFNLDPEKI